MRRKGFTLLELSLVILILAVLLGIGYGALSRHRANLALNQAVERLAAEIGNAKGQAQAFGLPQLRNSQPIPTLVPAAGTQQPGENSLQARITEKLYGQSSTQVTKQWNIGDVGGRGKRIEVRFANLPALPLTTNTGDQGVNLEIVQQPSTVLATVSFESDGRPALINNAISGAIYLSLGAAASEPEYEIEITPLGAVTRKKIR